MEFNRCSISNYGILYMHGTRIISAKTELETGKFMHWCKEDEELERLRLAAEIAVEVYIAKLWSTITSEEEGLQEQLLKKKTIF
jgi:hypothetical protein